MMWKLLIYLKLALGLLIEAALHPFRVPDDYNDIFDDEEEE